MDDPISHLEKFGYCCIKEALPRTEALALGQHCLALHADPAHGPHVVGDQNYQTLFGMLNMDERVWRYASHPRVVDIARHFLGPTCRVVEACSKPTWPGAPAQPLHADSTGSFLRVPDIPWMINTIWALSDFTANNGATGVVPMSHTTRLKAPPTHLDPASIIPIEAPAGSVVLWHGGLWHQARANTSQHVRIGLNIAYYPRWFNNWMENGHQPVHPETFQRMPLAMQALCPGRRARSRDEAYEIR